MDERRERETCKVGEKSEEIMCEYFFFSSRRRHTRLVRDWSSDVCSSDLSKATALESMLVRGVSGMGTSLAIILDPGYTWPDGLKSCRNGHKSKS